jgi:hypothetical protein
MPSGNLTVVNNSNGKVVATGCKTIKQVESAIYDYLSSMAIEDSNSIVSASFSVMSPYKKFGDSGIKGYNISRDDLLTKKPEESYSETKSAIVLTNSLVDNIIETDEEEGLDIV